MPWLTALPQLALPTTRADYFHAVRRAPSAEPDDVFDASCVVPFGAPRPSAPPFSYRLDHGAESVTGPSMPGTI